MFNVGIGEIFAILVVCLLLFGPERLPELARQAGRLLGHFQLLVHGALDRLQEESDLKDLNLPDLRIGSLRSQARDYVRELMDIEGQMAELQQAREELKAALDDQSTNGDQPSSPPAGDDAGPPPVDLDAT